MALTYKVASGKSSIILVMLDGKRVGKIVNEMPGWRYFPNGQTKGGELLPSLSAVKRSLESE